MIRMERRAFLRAAAAMPAAVAGAAEGLPKYRVVTRFKPAANPGMPGPCPGQVAVVHAAKSIDTESEKVDAAVVREMMARGMCALSGDRDPRDAWARLFTPPTWSASRSTAPARPASCPRRKWWRKSCATWA